ncbi:uncharacterized protein KY384_000057 [Bacidia gigantensis]|uniref:uncharacterized protein n=1 Tax=Bacidia gigantensis TaxID=2732470 RepID=UPI001D0568CD|nr:uncharacterized protein KY384_000057 [Bacidia gigantensis]KAG8526464.1 hypothetical protein KY384_000057 [Bacidia gigantensis]
MFSSLINLISLAALTHITSASPTTRSALDVSTATISAHDALPGSVVPAVGLAAPLPIPGTDLRVKITLPEHHEPIDRSALSLLLGSFIEHLEHLGTTVMFAPEVWKSSNSRLVIVLRPRTDVGPYMIMYSEAAKVVQVLKRQVDGGQVESDFQFKIMNEGFASVIATGELSADDGVVVPASDAGVESS